MTLDLSRNWNETLESLVNRQAYTRSLSGLSAAKDQALASWILVNELVSFLRLDDAQLDWADTRQCWSETYLASSVPPDERQRTLLSLPNSVLQLFEPVLRSSSSFDQPTRTAFIDSLRAGLDYLSRLPTSASLPATSTPLNDEVMFLFARDRLPNFPPPPSPSTRSSIMMLSRQLNDEEAKNSVASILLGHYVFPTATRVEDESARTASAAEDSEEEDSSDTRSIHTGIKEARQSIIRKEDKLRWLLGDNFHKGPSCRSSTLSSPTATTTASHTSSMTSFSGSTIRRPVSSTPTASRIYPDEATSTIGALPEFPPRTVSEPRDSVDSLVPSSVDSHQRHSRLISTSSSTAPLLPSARPSTASAHDAPPAPLALPESSGLYRRVLSTTGVSAALTPFSFDHASVDPLDSPALPTPPLQPLDSPTSSRPFAHLHDLPPSPRNKRNSLDSARDDLRMGRRESIPLDCQELSEREKSELVRRSKKLEKLLGSRVAGVSNRRRVHSDETELTASGGGSGNVEGFEGRRFTRPVSISVPGLNLGGGTVNAPTSSAPISPTTVLPRAEDDLSPASAASSDRHHPARTDSSHSTVTANSHRTSRPAPLMHRSSSTPSYSSSSSASSPTSPMCSSQPLSLYASRSNSSSTHPSTARPAPHRPRIPHHSSSSTTSSIADSELQEKHREDRRKKLEKVRRVLGERVPLGLVVDAKPQLYDYEEFEHERAGPGVNVAGGSGTGMGKSKSRQMGERLRDVFKPDSYHHVAAGGGGGTGKGKKNSQQHRQDQDRENWVGTQSAPHFPTSDKRGSIGGAGGGGVQGVEALTKARKLESLFGDLPPQSLYLAPTPAQPNSNTRFPLLRHRRSHSDLGIPSRSPSVSTDSSAYGSARGSLDLDLRRTRSNSSSVQSYRRSIASLRYVMEQDPGAFDEVVRAYTGAGSDQLDALSSSDRDADTTLVAASTLTRPLPASSTSHAAVKKAQKLSSFFGTTKGEVWKRLLDDIATAVAEDEELEDEERTEVLESLDKLREGAQLHA